MHVCLSIVYDFCAHECCMCVLDVELGGTQILETVRYFIKYHGINNYHGILINASMYPVKYSNNFS